MTSLDSYKQLIHDFGMDIAEKAGYIPTQSCQNLKEAQEYSPVTDNYCLITTGCFAPLHTGHVHMMNEAKKWLESQGHIVDYGSFVLAHQKYIDQKHGRFTLEERQYLAQNLIGDYTWLHVDVRANLYYDDDTNFTQIMTELFPYSKKQAYVFGSDRYKFGYIAQTDDRLYICVIRDETHIQQVKDLYDTLNLPNLVYIIPEHIDPSSSTAKVDSVYLPEPSQARRCAIRDDGLYYMSKSYQKAYDIFKVRLEDAFRRCSPFTQIDWINVDEQLEKVPDFDKPVISLDKYYKGDIQLNISRYFELFGFQKQAKDLICSTEYDEEIPLKPLICKLPVDEYILVDDDSVSGYTVNRLSEEIDTLVETYTLMEQVYDDVVDARDFLFGTKYSGLLCKLLNGNVKRIPYIWPYVNLYHRATIHLNKQALFSQLIKEANQEFQRNITIS